jgi:V/A-type H+/Na+-transporting ATPase subunit D
MAKIKHTKNELKAQREALRRYERFLPMLQLKKMQLQAEMHGIDAQIAEKDTQARDVHAALERWVRLFAEPVTFPDLTHVGKVALGESNVAGVSVPVFKGIVFERAELDLFLTPSWLDDALDTLEQLVQLHVEVRVLREQHRRIGEELRTTSQRVNLFEKVKIPEARDDIRVIKIFLGDQQTAGVARAKFAKGRAAEFEELALTHTDGATFEEEAES